MLDQRFSVSVHIMTVLSYHKGELMTSEVLASSIRTNPTVIRRLLAKLVEAGLVESFKGKAGGVRLNDKCKEITLKDIYMAVSGKPLLNTPDKEPLKQCAVSCAMKKIMCDISSGLENHSMSYLSKIKLADLTQKV
ncbi:Rrf2 family transcriptional regulator [Bdellovibrio sp. GT3]|uniref:Rrf2 family transcriptional regulator n=1 Tax=Bdellovibrio sp. GT3 TaxID=3136282 RepID=UPI0030EFF387